MVTLTRFSPTAGLLMLVGGFALLGPFSGEAKELEHKDLQAESSAQHGVIQGAVSDLSLTFTRKARPSKMSLPPSMDSFRITFRRILLTSNPILRLCKRRLISLGKAARLPPVVPERKAYGLSCRQITKRSATIPQALSGRSLLLPIPSLSALGGLRSIGVPI